MNKIISILLLLVVLISCSEYQKVLRKDSLEPKYKLACELYDKEKYSKAIRLFEQIATTYRGKPQAEKIFYLFSQSYYNTNQFYLAGYQFESFVSNYPKSEKIEECAFLAAKCFSKLVPDYGLDQTDTYKAIDKMQNFIDKYPNSKDILEANDLLKSLVLVIEKKTYENAKSYHTISDYKSALVAFENFINDYPGTQFKEDALFYKFDSEYQLAVNSVTTKKEERLIETKKLYSNLIKFKADTKYKERANTMLAKVETDLKKSQNK